MFLKLERGIHEMEFGIEGSGVCYRKDAMIWSFEVSLKTLVYHALLLYHTAQTKYHILKSKIKYSHRSQIPHPLTL
jgi:hypothetical protein